MGIESNSTTFMMAAVSLCRVLVLVSALFSHYAEAISLVNQNRVLMSFNTAFDICKEIAEFSGHESRLAADKACEQAFQALDQVRLNTCYGWRHAECRLIPGDRHPQCTCRVSHCDSQGVRINIIRAFRDCAPHLWAQELATGEAAAPTANFQQLRNYYDNAWQAAQLRRTSSCSSTYGGLASSSGAHTSGNVGGSGGMYHPGYGYPSAPYPSYAPEASSGYYLDQFGTLANELPKIYVCDQCDGKLTSSRALFEHKKTYHTVRDSDMHCYICNFTYCNRKTFLAHLRQKHPEIAAELRASRKHRADPGNPEALLPYSCSVCFHRYNSQRSLTEHMKSHTTGNTKCPICPRSFSTRGNLKIHMKNAHPGAQMPEPAAPSGGITKREAGNAYVCGECGRSYSHKNGLRDHEKSHKSLETYCMFCELTFASKYSYKSHMQSTHPEIATAEYAAAKEQYVKDNPERCEVCNKRFKNANGLRVHTSVHDGTSACDICNTVLPSKPALATHKRKEHPK